MSLVFVTAEEPSEAPCQGWSMPTSTRKHHVDLIDQMDAEWQSIGRSPKVFSPCEPSR